MPPALVFGGNGQLGRDLVLLFGKHYDLTSVDLPEVDIADERAVNAMVESVAPDLVLNAAAYTDVDGAEDDHDFAFRVNETGARNVAQAACTADAPVVFYSTDYVFGGTKREAYVETDETSPIGVYAASKLAGERATAEENPRHFIIRTAWLYGPSGKNFVEKIVQAAQTRSELRVVDDEVGTPTYTKDLAEATLALVKTDAYGVYHLTNRGECTRFEFAQEILRLANLDTPILPCASSDFPTRAERPIYSAMVTDRLQQATGYVPRPWKDALAAYMARRARG